MFFNYKTGDTILKIIFDKYFRNYILTKIKYTSIKELQNNKDEISQEIYRNLKWIDPTALKSLKVDEDNTNELILENKSLEYLRNNLTAIKLEIISLTLSMILFAGVIILYPIKRIRNYKYSYLFITFPLFNLVLLNSYIIITINSFNNLNRNYLEEQYKREIEKYNLLLKKI